MTFDVIDEEAAIRNSFSPKNVYAIWEKANNAYLAGEINADALDGIKQMVIVRLRQLEDLKNAVNSKPDQPKSGDSNKGGKP